ncbi:MAG: hypothetical protein LBJ00_10025 [Planctomycetaceae bacterium]|nr:hypothetical protein [Planctomycetaceae bacterium]
MKIFTRKCNEAGIYSSCFKIPEAEHASVASRSRYGRSLPPIPALV